MFKLFKKIDRKVIAIENINKFRPNLRAVRKVFCFVIFLNVFNKHLLPANKVY